MAMMPIDALMLSARKAAPFADYRSPRNIISGTAD
jgi:hypothetical protein